MTQQKTRRLHKTSTQAPSKYLWHSGKLVEWDKATVHASSLGWSAISAVFEGIRAYWSPRNEELYVFHLEAHLKRLAQSMNHVIPGHDPVVLERFPAARPGLENWVARLDADPK